MCSRPNLPAEEFSWGLSALGFVCGPDCPSSSPSGSRAQEGGRGSLPPAYRDGKAVAAGSMACRGGVGGEVVLQEPEPEQEETNDPQLKIEGGKRPRQWKLLKKGKESNRGGCLVTFSHFPPYSFPDVRCEDGKLGLKSEEVGGWWVSHPLKNSWPRLGRAMDSEVWGTTPGSLGLL